LRNPKRSKPFCDSPIVSQGFGIQQCVRPDKAIVNGHCAAAAARAPCEAQYSGSAPLCRHPPAACQSQLARRDAELRGDALHGGTDQFARRQPQRPAATGQQRAGAASAGNRCRTARRAFVRDWRPRSGQPQRGLRGPLDDWAVLGRAVLAPRQQPKFGRFGVLSEQLLMLGHIVHQLTQSAAKAALTGYQTARTPAPLVLYARDVSRNIFLRTYKKY